MSFPFFAVLPHPSEEKILIIREAEGWALPQLILEEPVLRRTGRLAQAVQQRFGLQATTLSYLAHEEDPENTDGLTVYAFENHSPDWNPPQNGRWIGPDELKNLRFCDTSLYDLLAMWFHERLGKEPRSSQRPAWMRPGYFAAACEWVDAQLDEHGISRTGPIEQMNSWSISSILKVQTNRGLYYYKATPDFYREREITSGLSRIYHDQISSVLATDPQRNGLLMPQAVGENLGDAPDRRKDAARRFARIQLDCISRVQEMEGWGCMMRPLSNLPDQIDRLWDELANRAMRRLYHLTDEQVRQILPLAPRLKERCGDLSTYGIPETLIHGDLHGGNILDDGERIRYIDWSDGARTHPFFDLIFLVDDPDPAVQREIRDAYLEPWTDLLPMDRLREAFDLSMIVAKAYHALSYLYLAENLEPALKWEMADGVGDSLNPLLEQRFGWVETG